MPRTGSNALATVPTGMGMAPLSQNPMRGLWDMQRQMNQEFDRMLSNPFGALTTLGSGFGNFGRGFGEMGAQMMPAMDVKDCGDSLCVQCELPGLRKEDVNIELVNDQLIISGQRDDSWKQEGENWVAQERQFGSFSRAIPVPEGCKPEDISANFGDGVLELRVLKPNTEQRHRIMF